MAKMIDPHGVLGILSEFEILSDRRVAELFASLPSGSEPSDDSILDEARRRGWLTVWQCEQIRNGRQSTLRFGEFLLTEFVHRESTARVFKARSLVDDRQVALKVLTSLGQADDQIVARLHQDLEASRRVGSPWVARCETIESFQGRSCLVREWIEGVTVREHVAEHGRYTRERAEEMMIRLARGLAAIHAAGLRHGSVSAQHVMILPDGSPVWFELGWSHDLTSAKPAHGTCPAYKDLEKASHSTEGDARTDAYFLGCIYYELLSGNSPHPELERDKELQALMIRTFGSEIPLTDISGPPKIEIARTVSKMMDIQPARRLADPSEIVRRFERIAQGLDPETMSEGGSGTYDTAEMHAWLNGAMPESATDVPVVAEPEPHPDLPAHRIIDLNPSSDHSVLCVEAQEEIQREFRKTFDKLGWKARMVRTSETAADMVREKAADIIIFDADGQGPDSLKAFYEVDRICSLGRQPARGLLLLGPKQLKLESGLPKSVLKRYEILRKPLKMREVKNSLIACAIQQ